MEKLSITRIYTVQPAVFGKNTYIYIYISQSCWHRNTCIKSLHQRCLINIASNDQCFVGPPNKPEMGCGVATAICAAFLTWPYIPSQVSLVYHKISEHEKKLYKHVYSRFIGHPELYLRVCWSKTLNHIPGRPFHEELSAKKIQDLLEIRLWWRLALSEPSPNAPPCLRYP